MQVARSDASRSIVSESKDACQEEPGTSSLLTSASDGVFSTSSSVLASRSVKSLGGTGVTVKLKPHKPPLLLVVKIHLCGVV